MAPVNLHASSPDFTRVNNPQLVGSATSWSLHFACSDVLKDLWSRNFVPSRPSKFKQLSVIIKLISPNFKTLTVSSIRHWSVTEMSFTNAVNSGKHQSMTQFTSVNLKMSIRLNFENFVARALNPQRMK